MGAKRSEADVSYVELLTDRRLAIVLLIAFTGTVGSILPPSLPGITSGLNVSDSTVGHVITAYKLPSILIIPFAAALADVYGRRAVLFPSLLLFGVAGSMMFFVGSFPGILLAALLLGIGAASIFPLTVTLLGDYFQDERNSIGQGMRVGLIGLGIILFPAVAGYLSGFRWNFPFLLFLLVFPALGVVYVSLEEPIRNDAPKRGIWRIVTDYTRTIRNEISDPALGILIGGGFARDFSRYALITFVPLFAVRVLDATLFEAGLLLSVRGLITILIAPFAGALVSHFARKHLLVGSLVVSSVSLLLLPFASELRLVFLLVACHTIGDAVFDPVIKGTISAMSRDEYRGGIVNVLYLLKRIAQTTSPAAFGLMLSVSGFELLFASSGMFVVLYIVAFLVLFTFEPPPQVTSSDY